MSVQAGAKTLLVEEMGNETNGSAEHEESVENAHLQVVFCLFGAEGTRVAEHVNEADGHAAVDVENEVVFLGGRDGLDCDCIV